MAKSRPRFLDDLSHQYGDRDKRVVLLTGNTTDLVPSISDGEYCLLQQRVAAELEEKFLVIIFDFSSGLTFRRDADREKVDVLARLYDQEAPEHRKLSPVIESIAKARHQPLESMLLARWIADAATDVRKRGNGSSGKVKPVCIIFSQADMLFPPGEIVTLSDLDRDRLAQFMEWTMSHTFAESDNLLLLVSRTKAEINQRVWELPEVGLVEIALPDIEERKCFIENALKGGGEVTFENGIDRFLDETAGLKLTAISDLLRVAKRSKAVITRAQTMALVNELLGVTLGDIIRINIPAHRVADIAGYAETGRVLAEIFRQCEDPKAAVSAILVPGPNGVGKSYQLEAHAAESGRIVIELAKVRGEFLGQTDRFFDMFKWQVRTYGQVLVLVDEADTAFSSVRSQGEHSTERRLSGNIIKMMGDPQFFGKVLWALMTARPHLLDPDVVSRIGDFVPIFDLEGDERKKFVASLFQRREITLAGAELDEAITLTTGWSARDYDKLARKVRGSKQSVSTVLKTWRASTAIAEERALQSLLAARYCSYPTLLPPSLRDKTPDDLAVMAEELECRLRRHR